MKFKTLSIITVVAACTLTASLAEAKGKPFAKLDANSDGKIDKAEFCGNNEAKKAQRMKAFTKKDKNNDGFLTKEEYEA